ncbi:MAG: XdhC family protein, partial [Geminicoccaceae bacterium]
MTMRLSPLLCDLIARGEPAVLVTVAEALGSTPREAGVRMLVTAGGLSGTIGGGRLEWEAHQRARAMLASGEAAAALDLPLGPAVGQCCGGRVVLRLERASEATLSALETLETQEQRALP